MSDPISTLLPCPFCGAGETVSEPKSKYWTGMKYEILSWRVRHWCDWAAFPSLLEVSGKTQEQAEGRWNTRAIVTGEKDHE